MANFELRIFVLDCENHEEVQNKYSVTDVEYLTDKQFVEACEENGRVYSLHGFLGNDVVAFDKDIVRAYFIDTKDENATPIRADVYDTTFHADLIRHGEQVKYIEVKAEKGETPISKTFTLDVFKVKDVYLPIHNLSYVTDVEITGATEDRARVEVETTADIDFDTLIKDVKEVLQANVNLIDETDNYVENFSKKTYTILVSNFDESTTTQDIIDLITDIEDVRSVSVITESVNGDKVRLSVETESYFDYDILEGEIDSTGRLDCEFIDVVKE